MTEEYFQIKDGCRQELLKYLGKAISSIPEHKEPVILDIGCGTGVPTIWLAENYYGIITAVDTDRYSLAWLQKKIADRKLENRIITLNISFLDLKSDHGLFDIIIAEGSLNVIGFENGFLTAIRMLKNGGYFLIHDEYRDHEKKCDFIGQHQCKLIGSLFLDENVWWNDYYRKLENEIRGIIDKRIQTLFNSELKEIEWYKSDPASFRSIYYIVKKL